MHTPVLLREAMEWLDVKPSGVYIDGTVGWGGHSGAILERLGEGGLLLGIDRDSETLARVGERFKPWGNRFKAVSGNFADMKEKANQQAVRQADGILLDLGMSSVQLDDPGRGFSFQSEGPLDMRMDRSGGETARDLVNSLGEDELADLFRRLGEEPRSRRIAQAIAAGRSVRPIETTAQLAALVERAVGGRRGKIHPATRVFQALRMAVNAELESLEQGLEAAMGLLAAGGRLVVISFHSLEDRVVKQSIRRHEGRWVSLQEGGRRWEGSLPKMKSMTRKPVTASPEESDRNPRSRSAKLRVAERMG